MKPRYRFSFDIGGTFTDLVLYDEMSGRLEVTKELTNAAAPTKPILEGLRALLSSLGIQPGDIKEVVCGATTLVTNLIIERKGAKVGLVTTKGFRDILEMRREGRYDLYDLTARFPSPLVPRSLREELAERIAPDGTVLIKPRLSDVRSLARRFKSAGVQSIAVCLLHSYRNPAHEKLVAKIFAACAPEICVSISCEVAPEIREFERMSSTVLNAYVRPFVSQHLRRLQADLRAIGLGAQIRIMQSNGGIIDASEGERVPIKLLESGPAAGAIATARLAKDMGHQNVVSFDMGGTTAKTCLISGGAPSVAFEFDTARADRFKKGSGFPVRLPVIDLIEIGAGGGSIARVDRMGLLQVGPESAGANPGPACYALGGRQPTVTDADLVLGYLNPDYFLGGRMRLDVDRAKAAIEAGVATALGMTVSEAASGIFRVVNESMANSAKVHVAEKGKDPRNYVMLAFGGAGPVHAREVAKRLGIRTVLVPLSAGVFSALGLLLAPLSIDVNHTFFKPLADMHWNEIRHAYEDMERQAVGVLTIAGERAKDVSFARTLDVRYVGQGHEVNVPFETAGTDNLTAQVRDRFYSVYAELFGHHMTDVEAEVVTLRIKASRAMPDVNVAGAAARPSERGNPHKGERHAFFHELGDYIDVPVFDHQFLAPESRIEGPAIIEQRESTTLVGPGDVLTIDKIRNLVITVGADGA
jgi:N-methylhydantoinase A/oxoprolinase/acetone carboxylase beta subunit